MKPNEIYRLLLDNIEFDEPPGSIAEIAVRVLTRVNLKITHQDAQAIVDPIKAAVNRLLEQKWNQHSDRGQPLRFQLIQTTSGDTILRGVSYIGPTDSAEEVAAKNRRKDAFSIAKTLDNLINPIDFEKLCSKVLQLLGVSSPTVTKAARDEGVDFFGKLNPVAEKYLFDVTPTVQKSLDVWLVGQAKHYPKGSAGTPDLRHLFGSVSLARANAYSTNSFTANSLNLRVADPVFFLFFTTGELSNDAWSLIKKTGIVAMDGGMLSAFLADRGLGNTMSNSIDFQAWLNS